MAIARKCHTKPDSLIIKTMEKNHSFIELKNQSKATHVKKDSKSLFSNRSDENLPNKNRSRNHPVYCIFDQHGNRFSCNNYGKCKNESSCIKNHEDHGSLDFGDLRYHPADRQLWCREVFPDILKLMDPDWDTETQDFKFLFNHRYVKTDGSSAQFMHEGSIAYTTENLLPILKIKTFFEISNPLDDGIILLSIFKNSEEKGYCEIFSNAYKHRSNYLLTPRELEILKYSFEGLSSKRIAAKLNLSIHTVKNHKRNCMEKTATHNVAELIHFCIKNNWL